MDARMKDNACCMTNQGSMIFDRASVIIGVSRTKTASNYFVEISSRAPQDRNINVFPIKLITKQYLN